MAVWSDALKAKLETLLGERGPGTGAAVRRSEIDGLLSKAATLAASKASGGSAAVEKAMAAAKAAQAAAIEAKAAADALRQSLQDAGDAVEVTAEARALSNFISNTTATLDGHTEAISTVSGNLSATYSFRAQSGSSGALLELVASSEPTGIASIARIAAENILLDGSVTARALAVGDFTNLVPNGRNEDFTSPIETYWEVTMNGGLCGYSAVTDTSVRGIYLLKPAENPSVSVNILSRVFVPIEAGARYYFETALRNGTAAEGTATQGGYVKAIWYDAAQNMLSEIHVAFNVPITATYTQYTRVVTAPTNAKFVKFQILNHSTQSTALSMRVDRVVFHRANAGKLLVDGDLETRGLAVFGGRLQSSNFVAGSSGWRIRNTGEAEFESLVIRTKNIEDGAAATMREVVLGGLSNVAPSTSWVSLGSYTFTPTGDTPLSIWINSTTTLSLGSGIAGQVEMRVLWRGVEQLSRAVTGGTGPATLRAAPLLADRITSGGATSGVMEIQARSTGGNFSAASIRVLIGEFKK